MERLAEVVNRSRLMVSQRPWPWIWAVSLSQCRRAGRLSGSGGSRSTKIGSSCKDGLMKSVAPQGIPYTKSVAAQALSLTGFNCDQDRRRTADRNGRYARTGPAVGSHPQPPWRTTGVGSPAVKPRPAHGSDWSYIRRLCTGFATAAAIGGLVGSPAALAEPEPPSPPPVPAPAPANIPEFPGLIGPGQPAPTHVSEIPPSDG